MMPCDFPLVLLPLLLVAIASWAPPAVRTCSQGHLCSLHPLRLPSLNPQLGPGWPQLPLLRSGSSHSGAPLTCRGAAAREGGWRAEARATSDCSSAVNRLFFPPQRGHCDVRWRRLLTSHLERAVHQDTVEKIRGHHAHQEG